MEGDGFAAMLDRTLTPEPWCVDRIAADDAALEIAGWALAPGGRHAEVGFTLNGVPFEWVGTVAAGGHPVRAR